MVRMSASAVSAFALFLVSGCAYGVVSDEFETLLVSGTPVPINTDTDPMNCGAVGYTCDADNAPDCVSGWCQCGELTGYEPGKLTADDCAPGDLECRFRIGSCKDGFDCRFGRCIESDPDGKYCEFADDECGGGNTLACVEGYCSPTGCLPSELGELNCNGVDDDCDGCIDGRLGPDGTCIHEEAKEFDVHFMVDPSGSMGGEIDTVTEVMGRFSGKFSKNPAYTFGTTLVPSYEVDGRPELYTNQTDFDTFISELEGVRSVLQGDEPQWDAVYEAGTGELPISWRPGATRIIIVFTDEEGHSYRENFGLSRVNEASMCDALTHGEVLVFFALSEYASYFNDCASVFELHSTVEQIMNSLNGLIDDPCV